MGKSTRYAIVTNHKPAVRKPVSDNQSKQFVEPSSDQQPASVMRLRDAATRAKDEGDMTQAEKFAQAARDLECSDDEEAFKGVLRKLAKPRGG